MTTHASDRSARLVASAPREPTRAVNERSARVWPLVHARLVGLGALTLVAALGTGCVVRSTASGNQSNPPPDGPDLPLEVGIDTNETLWVEPGEGAGLFVEYFEGGEYRITFACDTNLSGIGCDWEGYVSVEQGADVTGILEEDLEGSDRLYVSDGVVDFDIGVTTDLDSFTVLTQPGTVLRLEAYLDGVSQPQFVFWRGDGVIHTGAPTNPVDFVPSSP